MKPTAFAFAGAVLLITGHLAIATPQALTTELKPFAPDRPPGPSSAQVLVEIGAPDAKLGPLVWIYWNFGPKRDNPKTDTLVIAFKNDRVLEVKLTDGRVMRRLLAEAELRNSAETRSSLRGNQ